MLLFRIWFYSLFVFAACATLFLLRTQILAQMAHRQAAQIVLALLRVLEISISLYHLHSCRSSSHFAVRN